MKSLVAIALAAILSLCAFSMPANPPDEFLAFRNVDVFDG